MRHDYGRPPSTLHPDPWPQHHLKPLGRLESWFEPDLISCHRCWTSLGLQWLSGSKSSQGFWNSLSSLCVQRPIFYRRHECLRGYGLLNTWWQMDRRTVSLFARQTTAGCLIRFPARDFQSTPSVMRSTHSHKHLRVASRSYSPYSIQPNPNSTPALTLSTICLTLIWSQPQFIL